MTALYAIASMQGIFLACALFLKKGVPGKVFASIVLLLSYELFCEYIYLRYGWKIYWPLFSIKEALGFLYGPLIFIYVSRLTDSESKFSNRILLHFIPFILYISIDINTFFPLFIDQHYLIGDLDDRGICTYRITTNIIKIFITIFYLICCYYRIRNYRIRIKEYYSNIQKISLNWLYFFIITAFFLGFVGFAAVIVYLFSPNHVIHYTQIFFLMLAFTIYVAGYFALTQSEMFAIIHGSKNITEQNIKYAKSSISKETMGIYISKITACFEEEKIYLDPEITISSLSEKTEIPGHKISQAINETFKMNFYSLVNKYRIEHAVKILSNETDQISIISVCFQSGFNSKSVFNKIFKLYMGKTPSLFRKEILKKK
ncbi:MAG: AraC family transcriptional regulator [Spirochaetes bacterium]|nr:AraC family transcriptional regulator [Spirochaetota bacterium]